MSELKRRKNVKEKDKLSNNKNSAEKIISKIINYILSKHINKRKDIPVELSQLIKESKKNNVLLKNDNFQRIIKQIREYEKGTSDVDIEEILLELDLFRLNQQ